MGDVDEGSDVARQVVKMRTQRADIGTDAKSRPFGAEHHGAQAAVAGEAFAAAQQAFAEFGADHVRAVGAALGQHGDARLRPLHAQAVGGL